MKLRTIKQKEVVAPASTSDFVKQAPQKVQNLNTKMGEKRLTLMFSISDLKTFDAFKSTAGLTRTKLAIESIKNCIAKKNKVEMIRPTAGDKKHRVIHIPKEYDEYLDLISKEYYETKSDMLSMLMLGYIEAYRRNNV